MKTITKLWILIAVLTALVPVGLVLPGYFKAGAAWGEWSAEEIKKLAGYMPQGLEKLSSVWRPFFPDYAFKGWEECPLSHLSFAYIVSAIAGVFAIIIVMIFIGKYLSRKE